ncbi:MAG: DUF2914 domain-containing protein [Bdellovibrionales bacterium]|nr:DUF2914 domain-containing protein [Bdellovibrionales bacterium]
MLEAQLKHLKKIEKYKKYSPALFFVFGFLFDILTLNDVDNLISIIQQCIYIIVAGSLLQFKFLEQEGLWQASEKIKKYWHYNNEILHFLLGGLLSIYTLFYFVSSSLAVSLLFLIFMFCLLIINEMPKFQQQKIIFKYLLYAICLFSFFLFLLPLVAGTVSAFAFIAALLISSLLTFLNFRTLVKKGIDRLKVLQQMVLPAALILLTLILLYAGKILPPVPLSAKYIGIYHNVKKVADKYQLTYTRSPWKFWQNGDQTFYALKNDKIYCFVRVFAPGLIAQKIIFHWQNMQQGEWITMDKVEINIQGGRQHGFRGYVSKANYIEGDWRVKLENEDGREISRINFEVIHEASDKPSEQNFHWH